MGLNEQYEESNISKFETTFFNKDLAYVTSGYFASFDQKLINSLHKESVLKIIYFRSSFIIILQWNQF